MTRTSSAPLAHIETIAFDADDTLWHNEDGFHQVERDFVALVAPYVDPDVDILGELATRERNNVRFFGYGVKSFTFSMIETATSLTSARIDAATLASAMREIVGFGRWLLTRETVVFEHAEPVLTQLAGQFRLVLITKGDSHHQLSKVSESGLKNHFDHVEVVNEKDVRTYEILAARHGYDLNSFLMVGNSVKSDVLPVLDAGGTAVHIPYKYTWDLEIADVPMDHPGRDRLHELTSLNDLPALLR